MVWKSWIFFVIWETWSFRRHWNTDIISVFRRDILMPDQRLLLRKRGHDFRTNFLSPNFRNGDWISHQSRCDAPRQIRCSFKKRTPPCEADFFGWTSVLVNEVHPKVSRDFGGWWVGEIVWQLQVRRRKKWQPVCYQWKRQRPGPQQEVVTWTFFLDSWIWLCFFFNKVASTKIKNCKQMTFCIPPVSPL